MKSLKSVVAVILVLGFAACKKYEDGPLISIIPKAERVANTWIVEKAYSDNQDVTEDYDQYELYLTKDGAAELTAKYTVFGTTFESQTNGTWEFTNDKENIKFDYQDDDFDSEYIILKLTEREFWLRQVGQDIELHLKEK